MEDILFSHQDDAIIDRYNNLINTITCRLLRLLIDLNRLLTTIQTRPL